MATDVTAIEFHGARGSAPVSGNAFSDFGGDTPSIEIAAGDARLFIDAGSGLRNVKASPDLPDEIDLILSHYHYDHLIGLPFFQPAWRPRGRLRIWAPQFDDRAPLGILDTMFSPPFCPIGLEAFRTHVEVSAYEPGDSWLISRDLFVSTMLAEHPGGCAAIRASTPAGDVVYASDCEISDSNGALNLAGFSRAADLLIIDAMNDDATAAERRGWGHSHWRDAVQLGADAAAHQIALFHHDPRQTDDALHGIERAATASDRRVFLARQGHKIRLATDANGVVAPTLKRRGENVPWRCSR